MAHRSDFPCHFSDTTQRENVTEEPTPVPFCDPPDRLSRARRCHIRHVWRVTSLAQHYGGREPMEKHEWLAEAIEESRPHLQAVAYRLLGSLSEADDAVQEAWLRLSRSDTSSVENLGGWLTTVVARISLNMLRSRKSRREELLDTNIPVSSEAGLDPEHEAL